MMLTQYIVQIQQGRYDGHIIGASENTNLK